MADYSGSFSGSFEGNGSLLRNIDYYTLKNLPRTINTFEGNSILANNALRNNFTQNVKVRLNVEHVISSSAQLTPEFDIRYANELNDGVVSGSSQITYSGIRGIPKGIISSSAQITITESQISDLVHYTNADVRSVMRDDSVVSSSAQIIEHLPIGTVSSSAQIEITEAQISDLQSYLTSVPTGTISSSAQIAGLGYITSQTDSQTLSISGQTLTISNGNSVLLPAGAGGGGGSSIWTTGSQDPISYTSLMTQNNLQVTGSFDIFGDLTVNGKSIFTQVSASDNESAVQINGRLELVEKQIGGYIASASIKIGNTKDVIDCGGFF